MTDYQAIYRTQAEMYTKLVSREDYQGNLLPALQSVMPLTRNHVVECGAGTGRVTSLLLPHVQHIAAFDQSAAMLAEANRRLPRTGRTNWSLGVADNRHLPLSSRTADFAIAGWSLAHSVRWYPDSWRTEIGQMLAEMQRVVKRGGYVILIETLGTGQETPNPPSPHLATYYNWLETTHGYQRTWLRTDYQFTSPEEGANLTRFFFGDALAERILNNRLTILPECTGIWWNQNLSG